MPQMAAEYVRIWLILMLTREGIFRYLLFVCVCVFLNIFLALDMIIEINVYIYFAWRHGRLLEKHACPIWADKILDRELLTALPVPVKILAEL